MTKTKHTPGPWRIGRLESWEMDGTPFRRVYFPNSAAKYLEDQPVQEAHIRGDNCDENAMLIAAAPDLLHALDEAIEWDSHDDMGWPALWLEKAETAIAKAKGEDT